MSKKQIEVVENEEIEISFSDLELYLNIHIKADRKIHDIEPYAFYIKSRPGIGKTDFIKSYCKNNEFVPVWIYSKGKESLDFVGVPTIQNDSNNQKNVEYAKAWFLNQIKSENLDKTHLFIFDECTRVTDPSVFDIYLSAIKGNMVGEHPMPTKSYCVFLTNLGEEDNTQITELIDNAFLTRNSRIRIKPTLTDWKNWAKSVNFDSSLLYFICKYDSTVFTNTSLNPRMFTQLSVTIQKYQQYKEKNEKFDSDFKHLRNLMLGIVGMKNQTLINDFINFYKKVFEINLSHILSGKIFNEKKLIEQIKKSDKFILSFLASEILDFLNFNPIHKDTNIPITEKKLKNVFRFYNDVLINCDHASDLILALYNVLCKANVQSNITEKLDKKYDINKNKKVLFGEKLIKLLEENHKLNQKDKKNKTVFTSMFK